MWIVLALYKTHGLFHLPLSPQYHTFCRLIVLAGFKQMGIVELVLASKYGGCCSSGIAASRVLTSEMHRNL